MKKGLIGIWLFVFLGHLCVAQQDPNYTQYMFNPLNYNPAYAGNKAILSAALVYRLQWVNIDGAPSTQTFSIHSPLKNKKMGVGFEIINDEIGPRNTLGVMGSYAYRIRINKVSKGQLGFGLKAGIIRNNYDWSQVNFKDVNTTSPEQEQTQNSTVPNFDFGLYYHLQNVWYAGLSFAHLNSPKLGYTVLNDTEFLEGDGRIYPTMTGTGGAIVELNERVVFRPSVLARLNTNTPGLLDVNLSLLFDEVFWVGVSYRTSNVAAAIIEYEISDQFKIGYSYDYTFSELSQFNSGSHEIFLGYNFNVFKSRMRSPRYYF